MRSTRLAPIIVLLLAFALAAACGGDDNTPAAATATKPAATQRPAVTQEPRPTASDAATQQAGAMEVAGIVGVVSASLRIIEINRLSGAAVNKIEISPATRIRSARGGNTALSDIHPSDRIVARGALNGRGDAIVATEITVQDVLPGAPGSGPGG
ncbi:MAG TPA: hypothetical protein VIH21_01430 [Dehalococcoidia bacterium]